MGTRLVVLVPSIGPPEMLPSSVSPAHVLSVGPVLSSKLSTHRELFWSMSSYQQHEVNDFASKVVGHTVKGDACIVEEDAGELKGSLDDLLNVWEHRKPAQCKVLPEALKEPRASKQQITTATSAHRRNEKMKHACQSITKGNQIKLEIEAALPRDDTCSVSAIAADKSFLVKSSGIKGTVVPVAASEDSKQFLSHKQVAGRRYPSKVGEQAPVSAENPTKKVRTESGANWGFCSSKPVESGTVEWRWDDLQSDVIGQICLFTSSCASIISLSGVCTHWRKCITSDKRLLKHLQFSLDVANPLRKSCNPPGALKSILHQKHTGSFPRILIKAGDLGNVSAYTTLASLYEASNMRFEALKYWRLLSKLGDPWGCWKHGEMLYSGNGISRDAETAQRLLLKSGKQVKKSDHPRKKELLRGVGMCLGYLFLDGEVGSPDNQRAVEWFQVSAQNGSKEAQRTLGWMFNTGQYG